MLVKKVRDYLTYEERQRYEYAKKKINRCFLKRTKNFYENVCYDLTELALYKAQEEMREEKMVFEKQQRERDRQQEEKAFKSFMEVIKMLKEGEDEEVIVKKTGVECEHVLGLKQLVIKPTEEKIKEYEEFIEKEKDRRK
jgi:hypothetical protein